MENKSRRKIKYIKREKIKGKEINETDVYVGRRRSGRKGRKIKGK